MSVELRDVKPHELEIFHRNLGVAFSFDPTSESMSRFAKYADLSRLRAAYDGDRMVATFGAFTLEVTVPGGRLPMAGTTVVTVLPTHRRRGVFRQLMNQHLAEVHQRGEPLAGLWASESSIYGRFGYGPATLRLSNKLSKPYARFRKAAPTDGDLRLVELEEALREFPSIFDRAANGRPGMISRSPQWWEHRVLADRTELGDSDSSLRRVLCHRDGQSRGYVLYRTERTSQLQPLSLHVVELIATDGAAEEALWRYIFGIDLVDTITTWNRPVDDSLRWWLEEPRRLENKIEDGLWLRLVDVKTALAGRRYSCSHGERFVLRVNDDGCPWNNGVFEIAIDSGGTATCREVSTSPQVELSAFALGTLYLGGHRLLELARAGLVAGEAETLRRADAAFAWAPAPWCHEVF